MNKTICAGLALLTQMLLASTALAQTSYIGAPEDDWHDPGNWDNGVPINDAIIARPGPFVINPVHYRIIDVGLGSAGSLLVYGQFSGAHVNIGQAGGASGYVYIASTATWINAGTVTIGNGSLRLDGVAFADSSIVRLDNGTIDIWDSAKLSTNSLFVGGDGSVSAPSGGPFVTAGTVTLKQGSLIETTNATFGGNAGLHGRLEIDGASNATFKSSQALVLGQYGQGSVRVLGGLLDTNETRLGVEADSAGIMDVRGADAVWRASGATVLGRAGTGALTIVNGALADIKGLSMATAAGGLGLVTVENAQSRLLVDGNITFGADGYSFLEIFDGGYVEARRVTTGGGPPGASGVATIRLYGTGSRLKADMVSIRTGAIQFGGQMGQAAGVAGTLEGNIELGDSAVVVLNHTGSNYILDSNISYLAMSAPTQAGLRQIAGVSRLTGDSRQFKGRTALVTGGSLLVDGQLGGDFDVTNGILGGSGTIGYDFAGRPTDVIAIGNGGILAPGDGVGTLRAEGNVTFGLGATLAVDVVDSGASDLLDVTGTVSVNGGTVKVVGHGNAFLPGTSYRVLKASGGITGNFAVVSDLAFYNPSLVQTSNDVSVSLARNGVRLSDLAETGVQKGIADAIEKLGPGNEVYDAFLGQNRADVPGALYIVGSRAIAPGHPVTFTWTDSFSSLLGGTTFGADGTAPSIMTYVPVPATRAVSAIADASPEPLSQGAAWLAPMAGFGKVDVDMGTASWLSGGLAGGYDYRTTMGSADVMAGLALGYQRTAVDTGSAGDLKANSGMIGAYGTLKQEQLTLRGALYYGASAVDAQRRIVFPGVDRTAKADYWGHAGGISTEVAYALPLGETAFVSPLAGFNAIVMHRQGYTETGAGAFNLSSEAQTWWQIAPSLGAEVTSLFALEEGVLTIRASAKVQQALLTQPGQDLTFAGTNAGFTLDAVDTGRTKAVLGAGLDYDLGAFNLFADYQGAFSSGQHQHGVRLGAKGAF